MNYKLTTLTPLLVGDGQELAPIDYMVWKDQVNILDQNRIFKLLAKGPRLESYLGQLRRADKLDFASWGGFAQNFSQRRVGFEHASSTAIWEKAPVEQLFIPTFASNYQGAYLPGSALKGALRTALVFSRWSPQTMEKVAAILVPERPPRRPAEAPEAAAGASQVRILAAADSAPVPRSSFRIFLTRVANLDFRSGGNASLGWKIAGRGSTAANQVAESTPVFVEMAVPGTEFSGSFFERKFLEDQQLTRQLGWRSVPDLELFVKAANQFAAAQLDQHLRFVQAGGLTRVAQSVEQLQGELEAARTAKNRALLCLGWGSGFLSKASFIDSSNADMRKVLRAIPAFGRALKNDLPFPKTRRIVFAGGQPASLPGWVKLEL